MDAQQPWEATWEKEAEEARQRTPLKILKTLPLMPGVAPDTAPFLRLRALKYLIREDHAGVFPRYFFKHPMKYTLRLIKSYLRKKPYTRDGDFFIYGLDSVSHFQQRLDDPKSVLVVGFSYCHKPFECPSGRFTEGCLHDRTHDVCKQCFIGKMMHRLPQKKSIPVVIPTIHHIGEQIFAIQEKHPGKEIVFLITACELTLEMFGDWGLMAGVKGIGVRLDGRICNTFKAFELSEKGIKPGLTVVREETQSRMLDLLFRLNEPVEKA